MRVGVGMEMKWGGGEVGSGGDRGVCCCPWPNCLTLPPPNIITSFTLARTNLQPRSHTYVHDYMYWRTGQYTKYVRMITRANSFIGLFPETTFHICIRPLHRVSV